MSKRTELGTLLASILGSENVYYQPPKNVTLVYPAIKYKRDLIAAQHADGIPYILDTAYQIMIIDRNPDSEIPMAIAKLPKCSWVTSYTKDNLNHYVYKLYY